MIGAVSYCSFSCFVFLLSVFHLLDVEKKCDLSVFGLSLRYLLLDGVFIIRIIFSVFRLGC